ncbi:SprT-like domain-containing protein [Nanoarchaeota archaeon]
MDIIEKAFRELFPNRQFNYSTKVKYSDQFNDYGANISVSINSLQVKLSKKWYRVSNEIKIGLIQELLVKVFKAKKNTLNMDLYNTFVKKLPQVIPKTNINPDLLESFNRVNERYFDDLIDVPNLEWGANSTSKLGSYDFKTDRISISSALQEEELLDYVMYHEMLHKKHKFSANKGRNLFHSSKFRKAEKEFENASDIEQRLKRLSLRRNIRKLLPF